MELLYIQTFFTELPAARHDYCQILLLLARKRAGPHLSTTILSSIQILLLPQLRRSTSSIISIRKVCCGTGHTFLPPQKNTSSSMFRKKRSLLEKVARTIFFIPLSLKESQNSYQR